MEFLEISRGLKRLKNKIFCQIILDFIVTNMPTESEEKVYKPRQKKKKVTEKMQL